jgi:hypothetical protein
MECPLHALQDKYLTDLRESKTLVANFFGEWRPAAGTSGIFRQLHRCCEKHSDAAGL